MEGNYITCRHLKNIAKGTTIIDMGNPSRQRHLEWIEMTLAECRRRTTNPLLHESDLFDASVHLHNFKAFSAANFTDSSEDFVPLTSPVGAVMRIERLFEGRSDAQGALLEFKRRMGQAMCEGVVQGFSELPSDSRNPMAFKQELLYLGNGIRRALVRFLAANVMFSTVHKLTMCVVRHLCSLVVVLQVGTTIQELLALSPLEEWKHRIDSMYQHHSLEVALNLERCRLCNIVCHAWCLII